MVTRPAGPGRVELAGAIALILVLAVSSANLALTLRTRLDANATCPTLVVPRSLPCESVPIRFVAEEPRCTNELLRAMNVTNVRIQPYTSAVGLPEVSAAPARPNGSLGAGAALVETELPSRKRSANTSECR